jgi:hypothetical protein
MSHDYEYPALKITQKQVDKHLFLCERFNCNVELGDYQLVESESDADQMGAWYGKSRDPNSEKPGIMYIAILPDGSSHS